MVNSLEIKQLILNQLHKILDQKMESLVHNISSAEESRDSNTKSSAGDKYETSREMTQIEIQKNVNQLSKTRF